MEIKYGITGNYYIYSENKEDIINKCLEINKSINSIYYNYKYRMWVAKIKCKKHKKLLKNLK